MTNVVPAVGIGGENLESLNHGEFDLSVVDRKYSPIEEVFRISAKPEHDGTLDDSSVAVFIAADPKKVTRLWSMKMGGRVRLEKNTGGNTWVAVGDTECKNHKIGVINNFLHAMFCRVEITLGDSVRIADSGTRPYVYKSFFEQFLNCSRTYQRDVLSHHGYIPDKIGASDQTDATLDSEGQADVAQLNQDAGDPAQVAPAEKIVGEYKNPGWWARRKDLVTGDYFEFYMPIYHDLLKARKCLPPGVEMKINFYFNTETFPIWCGLPKTEAASVKYRLAFEKDSFYVDYERFLVKKEITRAYQRALASHKYLAIPIVRTLVKTYRVTKATGQDIGHRNWIPRSAHLPSQVIVCFVAADAYDGAITGNPYKLEHLDFRSASLIINSESEPAQGYDTAKPGALHPRAKAFFWKMMREIGHVTETQFETALTLKGFFDSQFFLCFDRSPSKDNSFVGALYDSGSLGLKLELRKELQFENGLQVIALMSYSSNVCIYNDTVRIEYFD